MNDVETSKREGDYRSAAAAYGAALGGVISLLLFCLPFPYGLLILCLGLGVQMAGFAVVVWRRTRLPLMTAAALCAAVGCAVQIYVAPPRHGGGKCPSAELCGRDLLLADGCGCRDCPSLRPGRVVLASEPVERLEGSDGTLHAHRHASFSAYSRSERTGSTGV